MLYNRYLNATSNGRTEWQNLTLRLDTSEVVGHYFNTRVKMSWPTLLKNKTATLDFPNTQVGNVSYRNITIHNPASYDLVVQLVLNSDYPNFVGLNDGLPPSMVVQAEQVSDDGRFFFETKRKDLTKIHILAHPSSLPILLPPGENFTFSVGFKAEDSNPYSCYLYMRNNLTAVEVVRLSGQGVVPNFKFGNRRPGSPQPLLFELTEKHLGDCERKKQGSPVLTVKRSFTARNMGHIKLYVSGFFISNLPCEGKF